MDIKNLFPEIKKEVKDFLSEEEGNISRSKILTIGSLIVMMSVLLMDEVFAAHSSHSSHSSHYSSGHGSHVSHASHESHASHASSSSNSYDYDYSNKYVPTPSNEEVEIIVPEIDYHEEYDLPTPLTPPATPKIKD